MTVPKLTANDLPLHTRRRLLTIVSVLGVLTVVHDLDHVRQGRALPAELYVVAVAALVSITATLVVLVRYPQWARTAAVAEGMATIVGVGAVHAAPQWSSVTDSYSAAHADIVSWAIIIAMMLTGLALALEATVGAPDRRPGSVQPGQQVAVSPTRNANDHC